VTIDVVGHGAVLIFVLLSSALLAPAPNQTEIDAICDLFNASTENYDIYY